LSCAVFAGYKTYNSSPPPYYQKPLNFAAFLSDNVDLSIRAQYSGNEVFTRILWHCRFSNLNVLSDRSTSL